MLDGVGLIPVIGAVRNIDEAADLVKYADEIVEGVSDAAKRVDDVGEGAGKANPNNVKVNIGQQDKHIHGTNNYKQEIANGRNKSILSANPQELLDNYAGTGQKITPTKERVDFGKVIGKYYDDLTGQYVDTTNGIIHYDSKGNAHVVPSRPQKGR